MKVTNMWFYKANLNVTLIYLIKNDIIDFKKRGWLTTHVIMSAHKS